MRNFLKLKTKVVVLTGAFISIFLGINLNASPAVFYLKNLNGNNGFTVNGRATDGYSGQSVSGAGDVNGDGIDDIIIGSPNYNGIVDHVGHSYVVFGRNQKWPSDINVADLNGNNGFVINGIISSDDTGSSVSGAGDINGDGIDDILVGAPGYGTEGKSYVIFGRKESWPAAIQLSNLYGYNGFVIKGTHPRDRSGVSVSGVGDFNHDGIDDILIGAPDANNYTGQSYVVFGNNNRSWPAVINLVDLNGNNGFALNGIIPGDSSGLRVSGAGDVNGDNITDILIGAWGANDGAGEGYVVFGGNVSWPAVIDLSSLNGSNGFAFNGIFPRVRRGVAVSGAGDVNGDGIDDIIIGASGVNDASGQSYVVFGSNVSWPAVIDLSNLDGSNGFAINGINPGDFSGESVSGVGDVNGDGIDDIIIGAPGYGIGIEGQSYVVYGSNEPWPPVINLTNLDSNSGFVITGINSNDYTGWSVSGAGDINGDRIADIIIGAWGANDFSGQSYVIFGPYGEDHTPLILGLTLGIGGGILLTSIGSYYGYRHFRHSDYAAIE